MSNGCETRDILKALGLTFNDLFYDSITLEVRARTSLEDWRKNLERQLGLVIWLRAVEGEKWEAIEGQIRRELAAVRCRIEPVAVYREWRGKVWAGMNQTRRERAVERAWDLTLRNNELSGR